MMAAISATLIYQDKSSRVSTSSARGRVSEHSNVRPKHDLSSHECRVDMVIVQAINIYHAADAAHYSATQVVPSAYFLAVIVFSKIKE